MPRYQKAYCLKQMREFSGWNEDKHEERLRELQKNSENRSESDPATEELTDESIVFLHENLIVSKSCFDDEQVVFEEVTPAWEAFCRDKLGFQVPDWDAESERVQNEPKSREPSSTPEDDGASA